LIAFFFQIDDQQDEDVIKYLFDAPTPEGVYNVNTLLALLANNIYYTLLANTLRDDFFGFV
jgi:hypothetical protein